MTDDGAFGSQQIKKEPPALPENAMYMIDKNLNREIPLQSIDFSIDVYNTKLTSITMVQEYVNESEDTPLETVFFFPVDIDFALSKIKIDYQDLNDPNAKVVSVETVIEERKRAE